jgi:hypothetical protein
VLAKVQSKAEVLTDWTSCWFGENKRTGYVTVTDLNFQKSYGATDISSLINDTTGVPKRFISLNGFTFGSRKTGELKQIRNIGIDLDQYKHGLSILEGIDQLQVLIIEKKIPEPNLILTSRGIQLFYSIEGGASPDMSWLTSYITDQFISKMKHIGADSNAKDLSRVMRVPHSINERNGEIVKPDIWNPHPYSLRDLQSYCKPLEQFSYKGKKKAEIKRIAPKNLSFFYKTNNARLMDLERLIRLRNGNFSDKRNILLYIYAFHQALICSSLTDTEGFVLNVFERIHSETDKPMTKGELKRTVKSAYEDAQKFFEHYKANGYKVSYKPNDGIIKPYKTTSVIELLDITVDEQRALHRMHTGIVSREKDTERKQKERRAAGIKSRSEYLKEQKGQAKDKLSVLKRLLAETPSKTNKELSEELCLSVRQIQRFKKALSSS